jgi:hypothetical protein
MQRLPATFRAFLILGVLLCPAGARLAAQPKENSPFANPPPLAIGTSVEVMRGKAVDIPLNSQGKHGETVNFLLRTQPRYGTLNDPARVTRGSGTIRYQHGGAPDHWEDSFTFATQASGTPVSAPARITIKIIDPPAALSADSRLSFGPVPVGQSQEKKLKVKNSGGLPLSSKMDILEPFSFAPGFDPRYTLAGGASIEVPIIFTPKAPGEASSVLKLAEGRTEITLLTGYATAPFSLSPDRLNLRNTPRDLSAPFTIRNLTPSPLSVKLAWPKGFSGPAEATVPGGAATEVFAQVTGTDARMFEGAVKVTQGNLTLETGLRALALAGQLEAPRELDFGSTPVPSQSPRKLLLRNVGGGSLMLEVRREGEFVAPELKEVLPLEPNDEFELEIYPPQKTSGAWTGRIHLSQAGLADHEILLRGAIGPAAPPSSPAATPPKPRSTAPSAPSSSSPEVGTASVVTAIEPPAPGVVPLEEMDSVKSGAFGPNAAKFIADQKSGQAIPYVKIIAFSQTTLTLAWPKVDVPTGELAVQLQSLSMDSSQNLDRSWTTLQKGGVDRGIDQDMVRLTGLTPGRTHLLRIARLPAGARDDNAAEALSGPFPGRTQVAPKPFYAKPMFRYTLITLGLLLAAGGVVWMRKRRKRG